MIRIAHIIGGLGAGGAEAMLYKLLSATDRDRFSPEVVSLGGPDTMAAMIRQLDIPVTAPGNGGRAAALAGLASTLRRIRPHLVQTWMYHANLLGGIAARALRTPVIWNIRRGNPERLKRSTALISASCAALSPRLPVHIVCCSHEALERHAARGYTRSRMTVIPNGFDLSRFRADEELRRSARAEFGVGPETPLLGLAARFDPAKDHETFLRCAAMVRAQFPAARFVLCGQDVDEDNRTLRDWLERFGVGGCCSLLGPRTDMARIMAGLDVLVSSSISEGFSNVLGEAMACEVPCVATAVGDARRILGDTGRTVPPADAGALAAACLDLLDMGAGARRRMGQAARQHILRNFSLAAIAEQYQELYMEVFAACAV